jgi:hypothetical protein
MDSAGLFVYGLSVAIALLLVLIYDRCRFSEASTFM